MLLERGDRLNTGRSSIVIAKWGDGVGDLVWERERVRGRTGWPSIGFAIWGDGVGDLLPA